MAQEELAAHSAPQERASDPFRDIFDDMDGLRKSLDLQGYFPEVKSSTKTVTRDGMSGTSYYFLSVTDAGQEAFVLVEQTNEGFKAASGDGVQIFPTLGLAEAASSALMTKRGETLLDDEQGG